MTKSITDGLIVGDSTCLFMTTWSTTVGANQPFLEVTYAYSSRATLMDVSNNTSFRIQYRLLAIMSGRYQLVYRIKNSSGTNVFSSYKYYYITPNWTADTFYIQNIATEMYMIAEESDSYDDANVHQSLFSIISQEQWEIMPIDGGFCEIISLYSGKYVGVSANDTSAVKQYGASSDYTKWYLNEMPNGHYVIANKYWSSTIRSLAVPSDTSGAETNLVVSSYTNDTYYRDEWNIYPVKYTATLINKYDHGYHVYYNETETQSVSLINEYSYAMAERYLELFGLLIYMEDATYFRSPIDICKVNILSSNINTLCDHSNSHTHNAALPSDFYFVGNNTTTYAYWTAHGIEAVLGQGIENRSFRSTTCVYILERVNPLYSSIRKENTIGVLMHEMGHIYGAKDHYHELADSSDPNSCKFKDICSFCGTNPRPNTCIMYQSRIDISASNVFCVSCFGEVKNHLDDHHEVN